MLAEKESRVGLEEVPVKHGKTASSTKGTIPEEDITSRQRGRVEEFKIDPFIGDLFQYFIEQFNMQHRPIVHCLIRKYIVNSRKNPVKLFSQLLQCQYRSYFSSLIGFFYEFGIGTSIDNKMALELYVRAAKDSALTFRAHAIDSLTLLDSFRLHNHYIGQFCLSSMFYYGKHVKKDDVKSFLLLSILAKEGSVRAQVTLGECYYEG
ncbi:11288_t:CDS:1, partial [Acaulospora colombiana]